jgi:hypothetical protein
MKIFWSLITVSVISFALSFYVENPTAVKHTVQRKVSPTTIPTPSPTPTDTPASTVAPSSIPSNTPAPTTAAPTSEPTKQPTASPARIHVKVAITGSSEFSMDLPEGLNHCDVLTHALQQGKISNLIMKYNDSFKSNGVYKINDKGNENQIMWVYEINSKRVPLGCSHMIVHDADIISWIYLGQ